MYPQTALEFYASQRSLAAAVVAAARRQWSRMGADFDSGWGAVGPRVTILAASAQLTAARQAASYVPTVLDELDIDSAAVSAVNPRAFVGAASDGRSLQGLLYGSVTHSKTAVAEGQSVPEALARGGRFLEMALETQVADTARAATSTAITVRPKVTGYVRMLQLPSCSRCAVLAGRHYKWNAGFQRHPRCDCVHVPSTEAVAGDMTLNARQAIESGQVTGLTKTQAQAIRDGGDPSQVINADRRVKVGDRYVSNTDGMFTVEGASWRGRAGKALDAPKGGLAQRLSPEGIYSIAGSRSEAIELLRDHGYIT